jgi:hypothetical protein
MVIAILRDEEGHLRLFEGIPTGVRALTTRSDGVS